MKTAHRNAARAKRQQATLPKFWRPVLSSEVKLDAKVIHWDLVNRISSGAATFDDLRDWIETGLTYSQMMRLLVEDGTEFTVEALDAIAGQIGIYESVIERYGRTGRVGFSGPELLTARAAACVMDGLIDLDRHGIAEQAAHWSVETMRRSRLLAYRELRA